MRFQDPRDRHAGVPTPSQEGKEGFGRVEGQNLD